MVDLTAAQVRALSQVDFAARGFAAGSSPDSVQSFVDEANAWLPAVTGRVLSTLPAGFVAIASKAIAMRVEQMTISGGEDTVETAADFDLVASFSAGPYTETRRDPSRGGSTGGGYPEINPWPSLNRQLWLLLDTSTYADDAVDAKRDYYYELLRGMNRPAWEIVEVEWARGNGFADPYAPRQSFPYPGDYPGTY